MEKKGIFTPAKSDSKLQGFSWRKVFSIGLVVAILIMFSYVYYGFMDHKTPANEYRIDSR